MEENKDAEMPDSAPAGEQPALPPTWRPAEPRVSIVLVAQFGFCLAGTLLGALVFQVVAMSAGWDTGLFSGGGMADATPAQLWQMRLLLFLSHMGTFVLAGWAAVRLFYPPGPEYLGARRAPDAATLGLAVALMLVALPLVLFLYNVNQMIPLPESLRLMEADTEEALKALLRMDSVGVLLANLVLLALLPAVGEELVFRGVLQRQLMRRIARPWVAILLSAAIFSFIHFQFEGFLPRWLLGILLGWLYWRTGNFWAPVAAHFANNALQVVAQYLYGKKLSTVDLEQDVHVPWFAAAFSALLVFAVMRQLEVTQSRKDGEEISSG